MVSLATRSSGHSGSEQNFELYDTDEEGADQDMQGGMSIAQPPRLGIDVKTYFAAGIFFAMLCALGIITVYFTDLSRGNMTAGTVMGGNVAVSRTSEVNESSSNALSENAAQQTTSDSAGVENPTHDPTADSATIIDSKGVVNINLAQLNDLTTLKGIGPAIAQRILDYRSENGAFTSKDQLMQVKGIGESTYEKISDKIRVK
jgi:comEA protein